MTILEFLLLLIIAGLCGGLAQTLSGYSRGGCLVSVVLGFIGALLGSWMAAAMGLPELFSVNIGDKNFPIIWSIIGGAVVCRLLGSAHTVAASGLSRSLTKHILVAAAQHHCDREPAGDGT